MDYKVLYRKYRPDNFDNIVGQEYITTALKNSIISGNISHAYIFSGSRGTGKTSTAKVFAKAINCINPNNGNPCNECDFCKNYNENPDIIEIDAASHNGVDQIRELIDNVKLTPTNGKYKVYIIDEVHMLSINAFNALLLTLEEPPKHVIFIFATTNIENVPITILSRCQRYDFSKISINCIVDRLKFICKCEKIYIDNDAISEIADICEGGLRDALSILDQLSKNNEKITVKTIDSELRMVSIAEISKIVTSFEADDCDSIIKIIDSIKKNNIEYKYFIKKIINSFVNMAEKIKLNKTKSNKNYIDYYNLTLDLIDTLNKININVDPFVILELTLLKYMKIQNISDTPKITLLDCVSEQEEHGVEISENSTLDKKDDFDYTNLIKIRINNCFVDAKKEELENTKTVFKSLLDTSAFEHSISSLLMDVVPVASSREYAIFEANNIRIADNLNEKKNIIENKINKKIVFITAENWQEEKEKYIANVRAGIKYQLLDDNFDTYEELTITNGLFSNSKIEII